jgi:CDGSH-type Zn-finger protein/uncharacterized Fe-S cluster protein YjdI
MFFTAMDAEPNIRIDTREDLLYLLGEASEIEHNLMCCYLFAAWSLKDGAGGGLSPPEAKAVAGWKRAVTSVAVEEMVHLALASNLMAALGGAPHFSRPNFPIAAGYHPSGVVVELARFSPETLDHFIYLERPEGEALADAGGFARSADYVRLKAEGRLMPGAQDYKTVGHLYRAIREGLERLSRTIGESALFCGEPAGQISQADVSLPGLDSITGLAGAMRAIDTIVDQGEGAPGHHETGHYARFLAVKAEYAELLAANADFDPANPVARNPVMRRPMSAEGRVWVEAPEAAGVLDLANTLYGLMLRMLAQAYGRPAADTAGKRLMADMAIGLMEALVPMGEHLATLPAGPKHPGVNAGVTFTMLRDVGRLPQTASERIFLAERMGEAAARAGTLFGSGHKLAEIPKALQALRARLLPVAAPVVDAPNAKEERAMANDGPETAVGKALTIAFSAKRCIHARFCVLGAPAVFKANTPGEWIFPDAVRAEALVAVAEACPSGAIAYTRHDGGPDEAAPPVNTVRIRENGPYAIHAPMTLGGAGIGFRATLCRCGASQNKPFCDGSHTAAGFAASGEPATRPSEALAARDGVLEIAPRRNGPLAVSGNLEICSGTGRTVDRVQSAALCRCGASQNKPFCDGSHAKIGFSAP